MILPMSLHTGGSLKEDREAKAFVASADMRAENQPPCMAFGCWIQSMSGKGFCATHELLYIAEHGYPSPPCFDEPAWHKLFKENELCELENRIRAHVDPAPAQ